MKKIRIAVVATGLSLLTLVSCVQKEQLPKNPKDKEEYKDSSGHSWIYDAMLMRWMFTPSGGGQSHYYYPASGNWTNSSGIKVNPPASASPNPVSVFFGKAEYFGTDQSFPDAGK